MSCILCFAVICREKHWDFNFVSSKQNFDVNEALQRLEIVVQPTSQYICQACLRHLKRIDSARHKLEALVTEATTKYRTGASKKGLTVKTKSVKRLIFSEEPAGGLKNAALPVPPATKNIRPSIVIEDQVEQLKTPSKSVSMKPPPSARFVTSTPSATATSSKPQGDTKAFIRIEWPSQTKSREVAPNLVSLTTMIFRGTFKQIANAAWRHPEIRACLIQNVMHELDIECKKLCSVPSVKSDDSKRAEKILKFCTCKKKSTTAIQPSPSCLRLTGKEEIVQFSLEKFDKELSEQAPLMRLALMTMSWRRNKNKDLFFTPSVCMAAAVCLKNRSRGMIALRLILTLMMQQSGFMVRNGGDLFSFK